jgi:hypothetical protein
MPRTSEMSSRRINSLLICLLLAIPLIFLSSRGSQGAMPQSCTIPSPLPKCQPHADINFTNITDPLPLVVLCKNGTIKWTHTGTHNADFEVVFDSTHTPFHSAITYDAHGGANSPGAHNPSASPDCYSYHVKSNTGSETGPEVHVIVLGTRMVRNLTTPK